MSSLQTNPSSQTIAGDSRARLNSPAARPPYQTNPVPFPDTWNTHHAVNSNELAPSICVLPCTVCYHGGPKYQENHHGSDGLRIATSSPLTRPAPRVSGASELLLRKS